MNTSTLILVGAVLVIGGLALGLGVALIGLADTFNSITDFGTIAPERVTEHVSRSVTAATIGAGIAASGLCLIVGGAIYRFIRRKGR